MVDPLPALRYGRDTLEANCREMLRVTNCWLWNQRPIMALDVNRENDQEVRMEMVCSLLPQSRCCNQNV
ncbi:hypothetical protein EC9_17770 [Rosistilla ulvae]|uniref:Uncharacterized protein n=1 Tax=Rosistilla ulvae TaxID=1930277 RepID=A0A517LYA6_9BACT|nr:hypothetical protein EC9_17770 [Rosistilla ulvae]